MIIKHLINTLLIILSGLSTINADYCHSDEWINPPDRQCLLTEAPSIEEKYLLYDVNAVEGFNLRRDVYIRWAVFLHDVNDRLKNSGSKTKWRLVLPPWRHLYHWSRDIAQDHLPWMKFFDIASLNQFVTVMEMHDFLQITSVIDNVFIIKNFPSFTDNGKFTEEMQEVTCADRYGYYGYVNLTGRAVTCLRYRGRIAMLTDRLLTYRATSILFHHAEIPLHDHYGTALFWRCRQSMRFSADLQQFAEQFRARYLNSTNSADNIDTTSQIVRRANRGGPYVCGHVRRRDFVTFNKTVAFNDAFEQVLRVLKRLNLTTMFLATDADPSEYVGDLKILEDERVKLVRLTPSRTDRERFGDGGIAIIDQIICAHARYFIGTRDSTFTFRIQEEREIMGYFGRMTFNSFCRERDCPRPSAWTIVYD